MSEPDREPCGTCDWGGCDEEVVRWRYSDEIGTHLPVCFAHSLEAENARLREQAEALATALVGAGPPVFLQFSASGTYFECCHCQGAGQDRETVVHADECQWLPAAAALRAYREGTK